MVWHGLTWFDMVWHGLAWFGMAWYGLAWLGKAWHVFVWLGMVWKFGFSPLHSFDKILISFKLDNLNLY